MASGIYLGCWSEIISSYRNPEAILFSVQVYIYMYMYLSPYCGYLLHSSPATPHLETWTGRV